MIDGHQLKLNVCRVAALFERQYTFDDAYLYASVSPPHGASYLVLLLHNLSPQQGLDVWRRGHVICSRVHMLQSLMSSPR